MATPKNVTKDRVAIAAIRRQIVRGESRSDQDLVAVESPVALEVFDPGRGRARSLGILMRTPGDDRDLVIGLLYAEGIIRRPEDVVAVHTQVVKESGTTPAGTEADDVQEMIAVEVAGSVDLDRLTTDRAALGTSACGLCGRLAINGLQTLGGRPLDPDRPKIDADVIAGLPERLREGQAVFAETGGLHAAGLFDRDGRLLALREDVGRHNALDKLVGAAFADGRLPARDLVVAVSGRVAYEIVQKTVMAGAPVLVAVGAPSSLAIDAAHAAGLTLVGFVRDGRFNIYSGADRLA
jgi:FdhD protein